MKRGGLDEAYTVHKSTLSTLYSRTPGLKVVGWLGVTGKGVGSDFNLRDLLPSLVAPTKDSVLPHSYQTSNLQICMPKHLEYFTLLVVWQCGAHTKQPPHTSIILSYQVY